MYVFVCSAYVGLTTRNIRMDLVLKMFGFGASRWVCCWECIFVLALWFVLAASISGIELRTCAWACGNQPFNHLDNEADKVINCFLRARPGECNSISDWLFGLTIYLPVITCNLLIIESRYLFTRSTIPVNIIGYAQWFLIITRYLTSYLIPIIKDTGESWCFNCMVSHHRF